MAVLGPLVVIANIQLTLIQLCWNLAELDSINISVQEQETRISHDINEKKNQDKVGLLIEGCEKWL